MRLRVRRHQRILADIHQHAHVSIRERDSCNCWCEKET